MHPLGLLQGFDVAVRDDGDTEAVHDGGYSCVVDGRVALFGRTTVDADPWHTGRRHLLA